MIEALCWLEGATGANQKLSPVVNACLEGFMRLTQRLILSEVEMQDVCVVYKKDCR